MIFQTKHRLLLFFAWVFFAGTSVHANGVLEPYGGVEANNFDFQGTSQLKGTANGLAYGIRVSWAEPLFFFGADASFESFRFRYEIPSQPETDGTRSAIFGIAGVDLSAVRIWLGLAPVETIFDKGLTDASAITYSGSAAKIGLGFYLIPRLSLNLELITHSVKKFKPQGGSDSDMSSIYTKSDFTGLLLSLSVPISL